jgi:hypothetical protein
VKPSKKKGRIVFPDMDAALRTHYLPTEKHQSVIK